MEKINKCLICSSGNIRNIFKKESGHGEIFNLAKCGRCGLEFITPRPTEEEIKKYYRGEYFTRRTDRGYDNYFSNKIKEEIERVISLNMGDLDFFRFEKELHGERNVLDIGCAAGYFLNYLKNRGWAHKGVDVSKACIDFARGLELDVEPGNYLELDFQKKYALITLWATIEHLHHPDLVLEKACRDLDDNGMLYISTCRTGGINFMKLFKKRWRYYNFPEHLYFFSYSNLKYLLNQKGFKVVNYITYGSGFGKNGTKARKVADFLAKKLYAGDMMLISARKI